MEESYEISDDDESFAHCEIVLSSDDENVLSDDEDLPKVELQQRKTAVIKNLFPGINKTEDLPKPRQVQMKVPDNNYCVLNEGPSNVSVTEVESPIVPEVNRMIEGVSIKLPVQPYGCQVALMSMLIKAIKRGQNCLLESPTGSGKTLALLCGALGWLTNEKKIIAQMAAQNYFSDHPELSEVEGAMEYISSPVKITNPEEIFKGKNFGEKSIYDKPINGIQDEIGQVKIHKRKRLNSTEFSDKPSDEPNSKRKTPEKNKQQEESPQNLSAPRIYYGARTHKQLQQVIKEFRRTVYCKDVKMSLLSSREYSCIREFDKNLWGNKNDMCKSCVKKIAPKTNENVPIKGQTNCKYYDNRMRLNHSRLPPAFDLEDLEKAGHELTACPYFAAREMAASADIVFCPYNYLIEPSIRSSMRIELQDSILIIDEAHNIEDICRDSATFAFTRDEVQAALGELEHVAKYRYENETSYVDHLVKVLSSWDYWFKNQLPLLEGLPVNNNEAVYDRWQVDHFAKTLDNHNIGFKDYFVFKENAQMFCMKYNNEPGSLLGVSQSTATLLESLETVLGYLFRNDCKFMDDFKPTLVRTVSGDTDGPSHWRSSQFRKSINKEQISLRLICMNPAVVFESLKVAKCIILASGTLTPLISLHSELGTEFPIKVSPSHVIPGDRVWIGTLTSHSDGSSLECKSRDTNLPETQDTLGEAILWVCKVTPHGVLCFLPSYQLLNKLVNRWIDTGVWKKLNQQKHVFQESRNARDHNDVMEEYYSCVGSEKGAILFAVYRGKVSEGMDFKDHQARAVITIGVPYPNTFDRAIKAKMEYNDKYSRERNLLTGRKWLQVQAYRALNQAVGRCVRHRGDWGAVLLVDARFQSRQYTEHLSKWVVNFLENNHHSYSSLINSPNSLESFMQNMTIRESEDL